MESFVVDYGHFNVKSGKVAAKAKGAGSRQAAASQRNQPVVAITPTKGIQQTTSGAHQLSPQGAAMQIRQLMSTAEVDPAESTLIFLCGLDTDRVQKEELTHQFFEAIGCRSAYLGYSSVMSLFSTGVTSGTVVDTGHYSSRIVPVADGLPIRPSVLSTPVGGALQTAHLQRLIAEIQGLTNIDPSNLHMAKSLKARSTPLLSGSAETATATQTQPPTATQGVQCTSTQQGVAEEMPLVLTLPDNQIARVPLTAHQYCQIGDLMFTPVSSLQHYKDAVSGYTGTSSGISSVSSPTVSIPRDTLGIGQLMQYSLRSLVGTHPKVCQDWLLCGGPSLVQGTAEHLKHVVDSAYGGHPTGSSGTLTQFCAGQGTSLFQTRQRTVADRMTCSWLGGSLLSQLSSFASNCRVTKAMYDEEGPHGVVNRYNTDKF